MRKHLLAVCAVAVPIFHVGAAAAAGDLGVNLRAGTLGVGVELSKAFSDKFHVGLGVNTYDYKTTDSASDVDYDFKFEFQSAALLANFHPFSGAFRFTGGVLYNNNELQLTGKPSAGSTYNINGSTYTAAEVGTLTGKLTFGKTAPYLGIGWGNRPNSRLGLTADIGALYQSSPKLALSSVGGTLSSDPTFTARLEAERASAESDLSDYKWYPVLSLGLYFRF